nr:MAG TPA: hypothetical protein [Crassvirales sp.]
MQDAGQVNRAADTESSVQLSKDISTLHIKGVLPLSFPQEIIHLFSAHGIPCDQGNNTQNSYCDDGSDGKA